MCCVVAAVLPAQLSVRIRLRGSICCNVAKGKVAVSIFHGIALGYEPSKPSGYEPLGIALELHSYSPLLLLEIYSYRTCYM